MTTTAEARAALVQATNVLVTRRQATADAGEKREIDGAIADINAQIGFLNQMGLLQAAVAVSDAANALQAIVDTARLGAFDNTISQLVGAVQNLSNLQGQIRVVEGLPEAAEPSGPLPAGAVPARQQQGVRAAPPGVSEFLRRLHAAAGVQEPDRLLCEPPDEFQEPL